MKLAILCIKQKAPLILLCLITTRDRVAVNNPKMSAIRKNAYNSKKFRGQCTRIHAYFHVWLGVNFHGCWWRLLIVVFFISQPLQYPQIKGR